MAHKHPTCISLLLTTTLAGLTASAAQGEGHRGIAADLAAARVLVRPDPQLAEVAIPAPASAAQVAGAQLDRLRAETRAQARQLYRISRAGLLPASAGLEATRRHLAGVAHLKRRLRANLITLSELESQLAALPAPSPTAAIAPSDASGPNRNPEVAPMPEAIAPSLETIQKPERNSEPGGFYGMRVLDEAPARGHFAALKGQLAAPVTGDFQVEDARRPGVAHEGLELRVPSGSLVRAVAAGRVAFADNYGGYGKLVILDHEDNFYTVYGGLGDVDVRVGDDLSQRARIGSVADRGDGGVLIFEVRKGSRSIAARPWLGL